MAGNPPSERVFVSGLPMGLDDAKLSTIFGAYGTLTDIKNLSNANACILNFATADEAKWVVENLDGNMPEGISQPIAVKFANPPNSYGKGGGASSAARFTPYSATGVQACAGGKAVEGKGGSMQTLKRTLMQTGILPGTGKKTDACQLYVRGLPTDTTDLDLNEIFAPFGAIPARGVKAMLNPDGTCTGIGFVDFVDEACARVASETLDGTELPDGKVLRVNIKNSTYKGKGKGKAEGKSEG